MQKNNRPKFLDLRVLGSAMSATGKVSILHRVSGVIMFVMIPVLIYILGHSLSNPDFYASCVSIMSCSVAKLALLVVLWAMLHHIVAGIRFLLLDMHVGVERAAAQKSAKASIIIALILTVIVGYFLW